MTGEPVHCRLEIEPPVARLTIARPPVNVLDLETLAELRRALDAVAREPAVHVLVLDAFGERAFSAGVEVRDHLPEKLDAMIETFHGFLRELLELDAITVALVDGPALGGGMELVACCDLVVASESAVFAQPEIDLGCFPPFGAAIYPSLFGPKRAAEIVLLGKRLEAREAMSLGLVNRVVPRGELGAAGTAVARELAAKSPAALRIAKRALRVGGRAALEPLRAVEALYREELAATEDMREGLQAFIEKRKPKWKGQ